MILARMLSPVPLALRIVSDITLLKCTAMFEINRQDSNWPTNLHQISFMICPALSVDACMFLELGSVHVSSFFDVGVTCM